MGLSTNRVRSVGQNTVGIMLRKLFGDERAAISIIAAVSLLIVLGFSALAVDFGRGLLQRSNNQRVADLAAYGAALVYNSSGSSSSGVGAAGNIAALNGIGSGVAAALVSSPSGDGNQAMQVTVTSNVPLYLARVLTRDTSLAVGATAYAEIKAGNPACIIALNGSGTGVKLSGGTTVTADDCSVASNNAVTLTGGTKITTKTIDYGTSYSVTGGSSIVPPAGTASVTYSKSTTADPLSSNSAVSTAAARIGTVASITSPSAPSVTIPASSTTTAFTTSGVTGLPAGCSDVYNSTTKVYAVTCSGTATFGTITASKVTITLQTSSGNTYNFNQAWPISGVTLAGSGGTYGFKAGLTTSGTTTLPAGTYNVVGSISLGGTTTFGAGTYNVTTGITANGGSTTTFGAGTFNLGANSSSCGNKGPTSVSICNSGTSLTFAGPNTFVLAGGIYNGGGASLTLGSGSSSNSYNIGKASDGNSINVGTSKMMNLADASGGGIFQTAGNISSGGGSCLVVPAAAEHDINGSIDASGGTYLGSGIYTIDGYFALGKSSGGDVSSCPAAGTTTGLNALAVSLVISGTSSVTCNGTVASAFCLGAGYSTVNLTAPGSGSTDGLAVVGPQSSSYTAGAAFTTGASNTRISGLSIFRTAPFR